VALASADLHLSAKPQVIGAGKPHDVVLA